MLKSLLITFALVALVFAGTTTAATAVKPPAIDICAQDFVGDSPCETRVDRYVACWDGQAIRFTRYRFRYIFEGAWSPWWAYETHMQELGNKPCKS